MTRRERHRRKLLEYLAYPDNPFPNRTEMASICGIKKNTLYLHFTPDDLCELEAEALELRRKKYSVKLAAVDQAVLNRAAEGDPQAAKLAYQRFEGWSEKQQYEHSGPDGGPITLAQLAQDLKDEHSG